jgi:hypothetical protein
VKVPHTFSSAHPQGVTPTIVRIELEVVKVLGKRKGVIAPGKLGKGGRDWNSEAFVVTLRVNPRPI